ncbi:hypothetical protein E7T06_09410 [Deinococcus sp. Arct2-2]|uniref:hypothetical protein n=1 Tax=Deinococcus sp. Arct2-2 TaxID=2568653 RepID=UPI0010A2DA18|nr:hypothetical protein [Deinococcus sp. Arct2-2]THF69965.1 hypothetical protein E7T06_09410 [Deinococcus sp. Arct2-2]
MENDESSLSFMNMSRLGGGTDKQSRRQVPQSYTTASTIFYSIMGTTMTHAPQPVPLPAPSTLGNIVWEDVEAAVAREQSNREKYTPSISVFRWWARRPHSLMGAIIDAAALATGNSDLCLSDPFSGGGTVAVEATRRHLRMYAQDLYPWPITGLMTSVAPAELDEFDTAAQLLLERLKPLNSHYEREDGRTLSHVMRVRVGCCPTCTKDVYLFPEHLISKASRHPNEQLGFYGCQGCGHVHAQKTKGAKVTCPACKLIHKPQTRGTTLKRCVHCKHEAITTAFYGRAPRWKEVLVQEVALNQHGRAHAKLRLTEDGDPLTDLTTAQPTALHVPLQAGQETNRLMNVGFHTWGDLYTRRQGETILEALKQVAALEVSPSCRDRLALAVIGMAEMPAYLCRWDRFHQKVFEGIANHHFAHTTFVVETNLLSPVGRGTLGRRIKGARKALEWRNEKMTMPGGALKVKSQERIATLPRGLTVAIGSSEQQALPDGCIDLALTDPPYFDDVQYGELARLFHFWLAQYTPLSAYDEHQEAVPNRVRQQGADHYQDAIMACLKETRRTLKPGGRLILTFHNRKLAAWTALGSALHGAGFRISALAVTHAENSADHSKRGGKGMLHDLVIECVRDDQPGGPPTVVHAGEGQEARELVAMGQALAEAAAADEPGQAATIFQVHLKKQDLKGERIT